MEANGTWPTHIAQLLFSGLGASSSARGRHPPPRRAAAAALRRPAALPSAFPAPPASAFAEAAARRQQRERQHGAGGVLGTFGFPNGGGTAALSAASAGGGGLYGRAVGQGYALPEPFPVAVGGGGPPSVPAAASPFLGASPFTPQHRRRPFAPDIHHTFSGVEATSSWSASATTAGVTSVPRATSTSYHGGRMSSPSHATNDPHSHYSISGEEEEELLSTLSPSSYIRRLHRELESGVGPSVAPYERTSLGQYQYAFPAYPPGRAAARAESRPRAPPAPAPPGDAFGLYSYAPSPPARAAPFREGGWPRHRGDAGERAPPLGYAAAREWGGRGGGGSPGRTVATALEIDSDDDDEVVEVIDVEALM